jgi:type IV pilus assembly protein PilY1
MRRILVVPGLLMLLALSVASGLLAYNECVAPPFVTGSAPPLVMLVLERDNRLYYQAYNDATDLDGDGQMDIGYKDSINYAGYFDWDKCYTYDSSGQPKFVPSRLAPNAHAASSPNHYCNQSPQSGEWSGNFLNWLSMARIDVIKRVLYGGHRSTDSSSQTVLEADYIPQDSHSWGKEYAGSDSAQLTPFPAPAVNTRHLFCMTSDWDGDPHKIKVALNDSHRIWEWSATSKPV